MRRAPTPPLLPLALSLALAPGLAGEAGPLQRLWVPPGFEVTLFARELGGRPIAQAYDERGRLWVLVALESFPGDQRDAAPQCRIGILEDADGDGRAEAARVFWEGPGPATALAVGCGGAFVARAPCLGFIPDRDGDGAPDGPPEAVLEGWGAGSAGGLPASLAWGPGGWLHGCQGESEGPEARGTRFAAAVWRYQPITRTFEILAEGDPIARAIDFDDEGRAITATRGFPRTAPLFSRSRIRDPPRGSDRGFQPGPVRGGGPARSSSGLPGVTPILGLRGASSAEPHALVHLGSSFPPGYRGSVLITDGCGGRIHREVLEERCGSFAATPALDILEAHDPSLRFESLALAPGGSVTILVFREAPAAAKDSPGRARPVGWVLRLACATPPAAAPAAGAADLRARSSRDLVRLLEHPNAWWRRTASRIIAERGDASVRPDLRETVLHHPEERARVEALWTLGSLGALDEPLARALLSRGSDAVRAWTAPLLAGAYRESPEALGILERARRDPSPMVRGELAAACPRLPEPAALRILEALWRDESDGAVEERILETLSRLESAAVGRIVLDRLGALAPPARAAAVGLLAGKEAWAAELLGAIEAGRVSGDALNATAARRVQALGSAELSRRLERVWGRAGAPSREIAARIEQVQRLLGSRTGSSARGAEVFDKRCAKCHRLLGRGHGVGPDLDRAAGDDVEELVRSIVDPNDVVRKDCYATGVLLADGRFVQGILTGEDSEKVTLKREEDVLEAYPRSGIRRVVPSTVSMMPEGLTSDMLDDEIRDLVAFVAASPFLSRFLVAGPFQGGEEDLLDARLPPEAAEDPRFAPGVAWRAADVGSWGEVDLAALGAGREREASYVHALFESREELRTELRLGSDGALKVWLNGQKVHEIAGHRSASRDADRIPVTLRRGSNRILIKVVSRAPGPNRLYVRFADPGRELEPRGGE